MNDITRCSWAAGSKLMQDYHDLEWGVPAHDDRLLFEFLILEGAQAGLSWSTVLQKRTAYRRLFDNFEAAKIVRFSDSKISSLLQDPAIIRNRLKIMAAVANARAFLAVQEEYGTFDRYIWQFTDGRVIHNNWDVAADIPAATKNSADMSRSLKQHGFKFVGPTICYAFMQAVGMVNDHLTDCFRHREIRNIR